MAKVAGNSLNASETVDFRKIKFIESKIYRNGDFFIQYPRYSEVSINFYSYWRSGLKADLMINNRNGFLFRERTGKGSLNMSTIVKLDAYDKVHVRIRNGQTSKYSDANFFTNRKID